MTRIALTIGLVASVSLSAQSLLLHPLDDAGVQAAIDAASDDDDALDDLSRDCTANPGFGETMLNSLAGGVTIHQLAKS